MRLLAFLEAEALLERSRDRSRGMPSELTLLDERFDSCRVRVGRDVRFWYLEDCQSVEEEPYEDDARADALRELVDRLRSPPECCSLRDGRVDADERRCDPCEARVDPA